MKAKKKEVDIYELVREDLIRLGFRDIGPFVPQQESLSVRDYFAGQALAGGAVDWSKNKGDVASACYHAADTMIKERDKNKKGGD